MGLFDKEIRENLKKTSDGLVKSCNEIVEANKTLAKTIQEHTKAIRELRQLLKRISNNL